MLVLGFVANRWLRVSELITDWLYSMRCAACADAPLTSIGACTRNNAAQQSNSSSSVVGVAVSNSSSSVVVVAVVVGVVLLLLAAAL